MDIFERAGLSLPLPSLGECICVKRYSLCVAPDCEVSVQPGEIFEIEMKATDYVSLKLRNSKFFVKIKEYDAYFKEI